MKDNLLSHKDYLGSVRVSIEDGCLHGKIEFIDDLVTYEGETVQDIRAAFVEAVDFYLADCLARGVKPSTTCKGSFSVRIGEQLHKEAAIAAHRNGISLNEFVKLAIHEKAHPLEIRSVVDAIVGRSKTYQLRQTVDEIDGGYDEQAIIVRTEPSRLSH